MDADDPAGLPPPVIGKLRLVLSFLQDMSDENELRTVASWKAHQMTGGRKGVWALHVTRNWRLTFIIDQAEIEIIDLNFEDSH